MHCVICDVLLPIVHKKDICVRCELEIRAAVTDYDLIDQNSEDVINLIERIKKCHLEP